MANAAELVELRQAKAKDDARQAEHRKRIMAEVSRNKERAAVRLSAQKLLVQEYKKEKEQRRRKVLHEAREARRRQRQKLFEHNEVLRAQLEQMKANGEADTIGVVRYKKAHDVARLRVD